jgi:hypothetical protein
MDGAFGIKNRSVNSDDSGHQQGAERKIAWQGPLFRSPPILATCMRFATTAKFFGGSTTRGSPW